MIEIKNIKTYQNETLDMKIESDQDMVIENDNLILLPALIDPHVHFRTPGHEYKEDFASGAKAAIQGGVTTVFDMPNNDPPCISQKALHAKKALIDKMLHVADIPLRYGLYFGASRDNFDEVIKVKDEVIGLKIFMGSSTGNLLVDDDAILEKHFQLAHDLDLVVAVHAEDEKRIQQRAKILKKHSPHMHSVLRDDEAALIAVKKAVDLAIKYKTRLYLLHISTKKELDYIREVKKYYTHIFAEACPHHLFFNTGIYETYQTKALVNPPLRSYEDQEALWEALYDGTIDTVGTDHAPHTLEEKEKPYGKAPSGMPSIENYLALLLNAGVPLDRLVELTHLKPCEIFHINIDDFVLIDPTFKKKPHPVSKCAWTPYEEELQGWPVYTILNHKIYEAVDASLV